MSAPDSSNDGTLEVVDDLHEAGRRRFIKGRSREELQEILVAVSRERDMATAHGESCGKLWAESRASKSDQQCR